MPVCHVDTEWLAEEARNFVGPGVPRRPAVVGGSGMIGMNLVALLAKTEEVERVTVLDIRPPDQIVLDRLGSDASKVEFVSHALGTDSEASLEEALKGCDCVMSSVTPHVQLGTEADFYKTNLDGIVGLVRVCQSAALPRLVFLSSIAVSSHFMPSVNQPESVELPPIEQYTSPYDITKRKGEEAVLKANSEGSLATCALRPGGVFTCPHDFTFRNVFQIEGFVPVPTGMNKIDFIDGRDVARAMLMAAQALQERPEGVAGQPFWITKGASMDPSEISKIVLENMPQYKALHIGPLLQQSARFGKLVYHQSRQALGLEIPGVAPHRFMDMAFIEQTFDNTKVQRVLGFYSKVPINESIARICKLRQLETQEKERDRSCC